MKLQDWLTENKMTAREFASHIGVDYSSVTRYLTGARRPDWPILLEIQRVTDGSVTPNDFVSIEAA